MTTHCSILAWRIPWTEEPDRLLSIGSQRVGHHWSNLACMQKLYLFLRWSSGHLRIGITYIRRGITLPTKVQLVKVFPVYMYGFESWTIKKAEHWRLGAFELWCWRRLLRVFWTSRKSNQSILKEISPGYSLEELMLKLKLQYFGHLTWRTDSLEKALILGKIEGRRRRGWQRMIWLYGIINLMSMSLSKFWELVMDREAWWTTVHGVANN